MPDNAERGAGAPDLLAALLKSLEAAKNAGARPSKVTWSADECADECPEDCTADHQGEL